MSINLLGFLLRPYDLSILVGVRVLCNLVEGKRRSKPVPMEYAAEASEAPLVSLREGRWTYWDENGDVVAGWTGEYSRGRRVSD